ncbi:MAG: hypothetical protein ACYDDV_09820 [Methanoregula sp.]
MTDTLRNNFRHRLGWCPNTSTHPIPQDTRQGISAGTKPGNEQPGTAPYKAAFPAWFAVISIGILFATLFVGGNIWWPPLVLVIAGVGLAIMHCSNHTTERN